MKSQKIPKDPVDVQGTTENRLESLTVAQKVAKNVEKLLKIVKNPERDPFENPIESQNIPKHPTEPLRIPKLLTEAQKVVKSVKKLLEFVKNPKKGFEESQRILKGSHRIPKYPKSSQRRPMNRWPWLKKWSETFENCWNGSKIP